MSSIFLTILIMLMIPLFSTVFYLFGIDSNRPDLLAIIVFYIAKTREPLPAVLFSTFFALCLAANNFASPSLFVLQAIFMLYAVRFSSKYLNLFHPFFVAGYLAAMAAVLQILVAGIGYFSGNPAINFGHDFWSDTLRISITTALFAPWLNILFSRLERRFSLDSGSDVFILR